MDLFLIPTTFDSNCINDIFMINVSLSLLKLFCMLFGVIPMNEHRAFSVNLVNSLCMLMKSTSPGFGTRYFTAGGCFNDTNPPPVGVVEVSPSNNKRTFFFSRFSNCCICDGSCSSIIDKPIIS